METTTRQLSASQVADRLGLTVHQVYRRLQRGDIPFTDGVLPGQRYLVDERDLQEYIDAGQPLSTPRRDMSMMGVPEVARLLGYTLETVRRLCYEGRLQYIRGNGRTGHLRIYRWSVEEFLAANSNRVNAHI